MTSTPHKDEDGNIEWRNEQGQRHRESGPSIESVNGTKEWYLNGLRHRENGPAVKAASGAKQWYIHGYRHRENGPAIEYPDGRMRYYLHGQKGPEIEQQVKENMARIQAQKDQQELFDQLAQDHNVSAKINISSPRNSKKL